MATRKSRLLCVCLSLFNLTFLSVFREAVGQQQQAADAGWQTIAIPDTKDALELERFLDEVKKRQPVKPEHYIEMQRALREVAKKIVENTADQKSKLFRKAEAEFVNASVMLLGNEGPDAQRKTFEKFKDYLAKREKIEFIDIQMAVLAGQNLEQLADTALAKDAYNAFAKIFREKEDASLVDIVRLLESNARRLDLPGKELKLVGTTFIGADFDIASLKNNFVLVYFWSSTTRACEQEHPYLLSVYNTFKSKGFEIVGISLDENKSEAEAFIKKMGMPWVNLWDSRENGVSRVMENYGISAIPTVFLLDKQGRVITLEARGLLLGKSLEKLLPDTPSVEAAKGEIANKQ